MSRAAVLGSFHNYFFSPTREWFALSRDGRRFARRVGQDGVEVRDVPGDRPPVLTFRRERLWHHSITLGRSCLLVNESDQPGLRRLHAQVLIRWDHERLSIDHDDALESFHALGGFVARSRGLTPAEVSSWCSRARFVQIIDHSPLRILIDQHDQLAVLGPDDRLIAMFSMCGREFAAWLPDGACWGTRRVIGGEPSKVAAERIAAALRAAGRGEEGPR